MIYQHPLHYLLGVQGLSLLRAYGGEHDRAFAEQRVAEIRRLLDDPGLGDGVEAQAVDTVSGYRVWAETYDQPGNGLFAYEEPFVHEIVDRLEPGVAVDAACGTGRHTEYLAARGFRLTGVDSSPDMLARARVRVPQAEFRDGDLDALPLPDEHADLVICALALAHLPDLKPAFAELARVLKPGGHLIVTDIHHERVLLGSMPHVRTHDDEPRLIFSYQHRASDYLAAALPVGLEVRGCAEPIDGGTAGRRFPIEEWDTWPWSLVGQAPEAYHSASASSPVAILWHFQRSSTERSRSA
ncbi:class I SAM-dependent methyltransferase [Actinoplanes sp. TRM 88003]|uniref:Class I SAM-dependent methyltransferase n=1 Tax=Paractinoplanes aksuensis TaxID=2939490 RepID=A0ABT1DVC0_9ACTN|nr:class I SAM-dependent methyltransferase [Actinoplanes aksuensis]MCO8273611.1 class I SAM-dependent methyltransferase [Actinoplanes aksuensis]